MSKSRWTKLPWIVGALLLVVAIIYGLLPEPIQIDVVEVQTGSLEIIVEAEGVTQVKERYMVTAPIAGKLVRIQLRAGDRVQQGVSQVARIEPGDPALLDARLQAECEARVRAAEAAKQRAEANLESSKDASEIARHDYERAVRLQKTDAISQADFDQAEHQHRISLSNQRAAIFALKVCEYELELARVACQRIDPAQYNSGNNSMELSSPVDGCVLRVVREDGGIVSPGSEILEIGDLSEMEMKIDVLSQDAVKIPPNAKVYVHQWGGQNILTGTVRRVEPAARPKVSALGVEEQRVYVLADFTSPPESRAALGHGFRIEASIVVKVTDENTLLVPAAALFHVEQQWHVFVVENGRAQLRDVKVGDSDGVKSQILSGLSAGERVINHPTADIQSGSRIRSQ